MSDQTEAVVLSTEMVILGIDQGDLVLPQQFVEVHAFSPA